ncbi:hypothetical protein [Acidimangrovimonas pyrenivorans]|uniref:Uncharacterized protein n=1 Tax=Acidimangrovimonas pyrenivorans TaxID=2030798 RepID=A0ABV7AJ92_9RHOB
MDLTKLLDGALSDHAFRLLNAWESGTPELRGAVSEDFARAEDMIRRMAKTELPLSKLVLGGKEVAASAHGILGQAIEGLNDAVREAAAKQDASSAQVLLLRRDAFAFLAHLAGLTSGAEPDIVNDIYRKTAADILARFDAREGAGAATKES